MNKFVLAVLFIVEYAVVSMTLVLSALSNHPANVLFVPLGSTGAFTGVIFPFCIIQLLILVNCLLEILILIFSLLFS